MTSAWMEPSDATVWPSPGGPESTSFTDLHWNFKGQHGERDYQCKKNASRFRC